MSKNRFVFPANCFNRDNPIRKQGHRQRVKTKNQSNPINKTKGQSKIKSHCAKWSPITAGQNNTENRIINQSLGYKKWVKPGDQAGKRWKDWHKTHYDLTLKHWGLNNTANNSEVTMGNTWGITQSWRWKNETQMKRIHRERLDYGKHRGIQKAKR